MAALGIIFAFLILLALDIPIVIFRGFILAKLWGWFIVPLGVMQIGIAHAIGLSILISVFTWKNEKTPKDDDDSPWWAKVLGAQFIKVLILLLTWWIASIVHGYMIG